MDKKTARQIANAKLEEILSSDKFRILNLMKASEHEFVTKNGVEYQIIVNAFYDDKTERIIRVTADVDDGGFWATFMPLSVSELIEERGLATK